MRGALCVRDKCGLVGTTWAMPRYALAGFATLQARAYHQQHTRRDAGPQVTPLSNTDKVSELATVKDSSTTRHRGREEFAMEPTCVDQRAAWVNDIVIQTTQELTTTGGTVWDAARRAAQYLEAMQQQIGLQEPDVKVLELGGGCGLLGMLVARNLPHAGEVCLTEQAYGRALEHLQRNVAANSHLPNMTSVTTCSCDWTHFLDDRSLDQLRHSTCKATQQQFTGGDAQQRDGRHHHQQQQQEALTIAQAASSAQQLSAAELADMQKLLSTPWDIIIGSDLVYNTAGVKGLPRVLAALMKPHKNCSCSAHCEARISASSNGRRGSCCSHPAQGATRTLDIRSCTCHCPDHPTSVVSAPHPHPAPKSHSPISSTTCNQASLGHKSGPVFYYAHTKHRFDAFDVDLFTEMAGLGLSVEEVIEAGEELPPPSPPPFSSLYPEMRIAMFKITSDSS